MAKGRCGIYSCVKSLIFDLLGLRLRRRDEEIFVVEAALAPAEDGALQSSLVALAVLLEALGLLALATFPHRLGLNPKTEPFGLWQILPLFIDKPMYIPSQRIDHSLLMFLLISGMIAAGVAIARLRAEQLFLEALAVQFKAS